MKFITEWRKKRAIKRIRKHCSDVGVEFTHWSDEGIEKRLIDIGRALGTSPEETSRNLVIAFARAVKWLTTCDAEDLRVINQLHKEREAKKNGV